MPRYGILCPILVGPRFSSCPRRETARGMPRRQSEPRRQERQERQLHSQLVLAHTVESAALWHSPPPPAGRVVGLAPQTFRRRWATALQELGFSSHVFKLHGLRRGGASHDFRD